MLAIAMIDEKTNFFIHSSWKLLKIEIGTQALRPKKAQPHRVPCHESKVTQPLNCVGRIIES
jgi:hypothetical protein